MTSVAYSPDGSRIVTGSRDCTAIVWDAATGDQLITLTGYIAGVVSVACLTAGTAAASLPAAGIAPQSCGTPRPATH